MDFFDSAGDFKKTKAHLLLESGRSALRFEEVLSDHGRRIDRKVNQEMFDHYMHHLILYDRAGGHIYPKHHLLIHMIQRAGRLGNPRFYMTYKNESLNGVIARIAASCHRSCWGDVIQNKYNRLRLGPSGSKRMHMH